MPRLLKDIYVGQNVNHEHTTFLGMITMLQKYYTSRMLKLIQVRSCETQDCVELCVLAYFIHGQVPKSESIEKDKQDQFY